MIHPNASELSFRHVPASHGASWWAQGWRSFLRAPWAWVGMSLALIVGSVILHMFPMGGAVAQWLSMPVFTLGAEYVVVRSIGRAGDHGHQQQPAQPEGDGGGDG